MLLLDSFSFSWERSLGGVQSPQAVRSVRSLLPARSPCPPPPSDPLPAVQSGSQLTAVLASTAGSSRASFRILLLSDSCHFRDMSWCRGLFGFILFATLRVSWTWVSVSFPRGGKFSAIISLNKVCSFFPSPSGIPIMRTFEHLMLSRSSLKLSAFIKFLLLFAVLTGFFPPVCAVADAFLSVPGVWSCAGAWALARQAGVALGSEVLFPLTPSSEAGGSGWCSRGCAVVMRRVGQAPKELPAPSQWRGRERGAPHPSSQESSHGSRPPPAPPL